MKIAHIADVHIRLKDRHDEYREVFSRLYEDLKEVEPDRIVLAGDIVHSKVTLSPECVSLTVEFLQNLSRIAPVDIIVGNHDMNMSNINRMDSLTPIVEAANGILNDHKVTYYKETGYYDVDDNLVYGVNSLIDEKPDLRLTTRAKKSGKIYVAIYHGAVQGCVLDNDYQYDEARVSDKTFENFDYVMLGDIHKRQPIRPDGTMWYAGSLIQQNHGEELDKGYLVWQIKDRKHYDVELRKIENDYCFYTIRADGGELPDVELPSKCRMRVIWPVSANDISKNDILHIKKAFTDNTGPYRYNHIIICLNVCYPGRPCSVDPAERGNRTGSCQSKGKDGHRSANLCSVLEICKAAGKRRPGAVIPLPPLCEQHIS